MKIIATSDLHGNLPARIPECDLFIIAGDICPDNRWTQAHPEKCAMIQLEWVEKVFEPWAAYNEQYWHDSIFIWGNHDYVGEERYKWKPPVEVLGRKVHTDEYVTNLPDWALNRDEHADTLAWEHAPACDILITHAPAWGTGDKLCGMYGRPGASVGSKALAQYVLRHPPKVHFFGHIHEARGEYGAAFNCSYVDEYYLPYNRRMVEVNL